MRLCLERLQGVSVLQTGRKTFKAWGWLQGIVARTKQHFFLRVGSHDGRAAFQLEFVTLSMPH